MNRPEGISESAWAAAEQYADELHERDDYMHFESRKVLSRAIQSSVEAEREACAEAAETDARIEMQWAEMSLPVSQGPIIAKDRAKVAERIAIAIRSRKGA